MLKLSRNSLLASDKTPIIQPTSPKLSSSPSLKSSPVKRGFKPNMSAAFLRRRSDLPSPITPDGEDSGKGRCSASLPSLGHNLSEEDFSIFTFKGVKSLDGKDHLLSMASTNDSSIPEINRVFDDQLLGNDDPMIDESNLPFKGYRIMIAGSKKAGKRSFVKNLFSDKVFNGLLNYRKDKFDLMTKKVVEMTIVRKFCFWVKEIELLGNQTKAEELYKSIYDMYYKSCVTIFLVYDKEDRESFFALKEELKSLKKLFNELENKKIVILRNDKQHFLDDYSGRNLEVSREEEDELRNQYQVNLRFDLDGNPDTFKSIYNLII